MNLNWIENHYEYPEIDLSAETYFEDYPSNNDPIYVYGFKTVAQLKELLTGRAGREFSVAEISEIAKTAFRNKPEKKGKRKIPDNRQPADFIYQF